MSSSPPATRAAFCEEFSEEAQKTLPETRQTASTANIAAKRSKPDATKGRLLRDEFSDSGYSSHTAATLGSGDSSSLESRREVPLERSDDASAESNATVKDGQNESKSRSQSPEKNTLQRSASKGKGYETSRQRDCECTECLKKKSKRRTLPQLDTEYSDPTTIKPRQKDPISPLSPQLDRSVPPYPPPEAAPLQAVLPTARPRASTSQSYKQHRPVSFHAGTMPHLPYIQHPAFIERPQMAGYTTSSPFPPASYSTPQPSYFSPLQPLQPQEFFAPATPVTSPFEGQSRARPVVSVRPQTMYHDVSAPLGEYAQPIYQPFRSFDRPIERQSRRQQPQLPTKEYVDQTEARHRMPPPPAPPRGPSKSRQESRPVIRHATTTTAAYPLSHQRNITRDPEEDPGKSRSTSRKHSFEAPPRSRRPSIARPPLTSDEKVAQALQLERDMSRMTTSERTTTSPQSKRRSSVYGHESLKDLEGSVEAYQVSKSGREFASIPTGDEMMRLFRKKTLPTSNSSDTGSRMSGGSRASRDGSDNKPVRRPSNDLKKRNSNDEAFAMRIPRGANINLQPGFEGRSISLRPSRDGDGEMELRIGERGRAGTNGLVGSRPAIREKSRKRYSIIDGQALIESERDPQPNSSRTPSRRESMGRRPEDARIVEREIGDDNQRRIVRERIVTRIADRSRRGSRNRNGEMDQNMF